MKKIYFILCLAIVCLSGSAQLKSDYKPFKVDVAIGYASPAGSGAKGGILFAVEPKYAVIPSLSIGLRMEAAIVARFSGYDQDGDPLDVSVKAAASYLATGDFYFPLPGGKLFRPFAGAGAGIYTIASAQLNTNGDGAAGAGTKFGAMTRAGFEISHFRFGVEYNIVPSSKLNGYDMNGNPAEIISKNSYLGVKIGAFFGGGRRK
ncbi:MAG TPA: outer membrane beta-barrel protein [Chitinophagaceae bacterium]|jgi:outer membrane protein X|nr:outer membrane beta-barrel protein [Chitinophagaceae bacterium]